VRVWDLPWPVVRQFEIRGVPEGETRGNHAHRTCRQIVQCPAGSFKLHAYWYDEHRMQHLFDRTVCPGVSVEIPPLHWIVMSGFSLDAVASVLCSEPYTVPISDWEEFLRA
jgi:hypothetical protein